MGAKCCCSRPGQEVGRARPAPSQVCRRGTRRLKEKAARPRLKATRRRERDHWTQLRGRECRSHRQGTGSLSFLILWNQFPATSRTGAGTSEELNRSAHAPQAGHTPPDVQSPPPQESEQKKDMCAMRAGLDFATSWSGNKERSRRACWKRVGHFQVHAMLTGQAGPLVLLLQRRLCLSPQALPHKSGQGLENVRDGREKRREEGGGELQGVGRALQELGCLHGIPPTAGSALLEASADTLEPWALPEAHSSISILADIN